MKTTAELATIARRAAADLRSGNTSNVAEYDALRAAYPDETDLIDECDSDEDAAADLIELAAQIEG